MTPAVEIRPEALPGLLCELARACGTATAFRTAELFGGLELYIPHELPDDHRLIAALGRPAARWLHAQYSGEHLRIPQMKSLRTWALVQQLNAEGRSRRRIARRLRISERHVRRLLEGVPAGAALVAETDAVAARRRPCPLCGHAERPRPAARPGEPDPRQLALEL